MLKEGRDCSQSTQNLGLTKPLTRAENVEKKYEKNLKKWKTLLILSITDKLVSHYMFHYWIVSWQTSFKEMEAKFNGFKRLHMWAVTGTFWSILYFLFKAHDSSNKSILGWVFKTRSMILILKEHPCNNIEQKNFLLVIYMFTHLISISTRDSNSF